MYDTILKMPRPGRQGKPSSRESKKEERNWSESEKAMISVQKKAESFYFRSQSGLSS